MTSSRLLIDFGVRRETPGQVQHHRMIQIYENELFELGVLKGSKWGGEETLRKRGWAKFTNFAGDRHVPTSEYAEKIPAGSNKKKAKTVKLSPAAALAVAAKVVESGTPPKPERRKSAVIIAEEVAVRKRQAEKDAAAAAAADKEGDQIGAHDNTEADTNEGIDDSTEDVDEKAEYGDDTSDVDEEEEKSEIQFWNPICPEGFEWITAWKINKIYLQTSDDGCWTYGNNLKHIMEMEKKCRSRTTSSGSYARRRVWFRIMAKIDVDPILPKPFTLPMRMACFFDISESRESTFLMNAYENQRWSPLLLSWGNKFPGHLLFHDPAATTNASGKQKIRHWSDLDALPPGFRWASEWTVDERPGITGEEGYMYAADFPSFYDSKGRVKLANGATANVRRRRWVRRMVPTREHVRKTIDLDPMPLPALYPSSGLLRPLQGKAERRGLHHVDVILVHGFSGSSVDTFEGPIKLSERNTYWPAEYLFSDDKFTSVYGVPGASKLHLTQSVRTLVVEHGLFLDVRDPMWTMKNAVQLLLEALKNALVGCRPIIWIGHSIGGLLIKELLYNSFKLENNSLFALTRGVVFLATPHHGTSSINTMIDMRITKKTATTEYLKPSMHFHEMQSWFDSTDIEYINIVEDKDIPSRHFSGVLASVLMKFVGLRIVQVNDGMLTMGSEPMDDLDTPIRYNHLAALDHWSLGAMKLGNPEYDKVYSLVRLSVARWLRAKNQDSRTAWYSFSSAISEELFLLSRFMYEILRTNSRIARTIKLLEHKANPAVLLSLMKKLTTGSQRQARLERLSAITDLDIDNLDRMEDFMRERPSLDTYVGKYRIEIEAQLCVLTENISDSTQKEEKMEELLQMYSTTLLALQCTEDLENVKDFLLDKKVCAARVGDMLFWIELGRCCKDMLISKGGAQYKRDSEYSHEEIDACIDNIHHKLMDAISEVNESMRASVEKDLNRPEAVVRASMLQVAAQGHMPDYAPPPPPSALKPNSSSPTEVPPPVPDKIPQYIIGEEDDDLDVVTVPIPPLPSLPPPHDDACIRHNIENGATHSMSKIFINGSSSDDGEVATGPPLGSPLVMHSPVCLD